MEGDDLNEELDGPDLREDLHHVPVGLAIFRGQARLLHRLLSAARLFSFSQ